MRPILFTIASFFLICAIANGQTFSLTVEGAMQGKFKPESLRQKDRIDAISFSQEVITPRDLATGQSSGRRQYQPIIIVKSAGASSPQFLQALINNELLKKVTIEFTKTNPSGEEYVFYRVTLEDARLAGYKQFTMSPTEGGATAKHVSASEGNLFDEIKFTFRKISVESTDGKTMAADDWSIGR